jgi:sulfane dehydrogenase subunit SoxC
MPPEEVRKVPAEPAIEESGLSRRSLIQRAGVIGSAVAAGVALPAIGTAVPEAVAAQSTPVAATPVAGDLTMPPDIPPWMQVWGPLPSEYGARSPFEDGVVRMPSKTSSRTPLQHLTGTMTPSSLFYERHHAGIPAIDPALHRLLIHGMVERPMVFSMDDIRRFPSISVIHFMECSGNSGSEWTEESIAKDVQAGFGLVSQVEWTGVPLKTLLAQVGVDPSATWILAEGADAAGMTRSIPMDKAMDDALIAYAMNGEALRPENGYPVRLFLPGWEGNASIKWLRRLKIGDQPWMTREETSKYTDLMPDGTARQFTFAMEAKSVITYPSAGHKLTGPGFWEISGIAWSGRGAITRVEVSTDGGETWTDAELQGPVLPIALTRFRLPWTWDGNPARLQSRATDDTGYVQPTIAELVAVRGVNSNYHMNGIKSWAVSADGEVTSAWG